ncbi:MAG: hypothetical protein D6826_08685, partial [Alphaproteobacteria bacterium]
MARLPIGEKESPCYGVGRREMTDRGRQVSHMMATTPVQGPARGPRHVPGAFMRAAMTAAALTAAMAGAPVAAGSITATPAPRQVIAAGTADGSGTTTWELPDGQPYLYIPQIPTALGGAVAEVAPGAQVGVILFPQPFFRTRDAGCAPDIGSAMRPDLKWLGATAAFAPVPPGHVPPSPTADGRGKPPETFASLIVYQRDLGPPPGLLLMERRRTVGVRCANPIYKTLYNRMFVPVAVPPQAARCVDLSGAWRSEDSMPEVVVQFNNADRAVLLMPADMDERYGAVRHDVTVSLYDGFGCQGTGLTFKSGASLSRDHRLDRFDFRARARSVRLVYEEGALRPYLERPAPALARTPIPEKVAEKVVEKLPEKASRARSPLPTPLAPEAPPPPVKPVATPLP